MASYSVARAKHATLSGAAVDTVTITDPGTTVEVYNRTTGSEVLYVTVNGPTPVAGADDTDVILPGQALLLSRRSGGSAIVRIIGNGNPYSVSAL